MKIFTTCRLLECVLSLYALTTLACSEKHRLVITHYIAHTHDWSHLDFVFIFPHCLIITFTKDQVMFSEPWTCLGINCSEPCVVTSNTAVLPHKQGCINQPSFPMLWINPGCHLLHEPITPAPLNQLLILALFLGNLSISQIDRKSGNIRLSIPCQPGYSEIYHAGLPSPCGLVNLTDTYVLGKVYEEP
jgi:hypothetical protein